MKYRNHNSTMNYRNHYKGLETIGRKTRKERPHGNIKVRENTFIIKTNATYSRRDCAKQVVIMGVESDS